MAPDKIYVTESIYGNTMMQVADEESVEYINKDALLEWAKERYKHYQQHQDDAVCWGQRNAFQQMIDKINNL